MSGPLDAAAILEREYLGVRAKLLEVAATLDRLDRADGLAADDPRLARIYAGLAILEQGPASGRAEAIQQLFSLPYDPHWRRTFGLAATER